MLEDKLLLFDIDGTLVDTSDLEVLKKNYDGRDFLDKNISRFSLKAISDDLKKFVNLAASKDNLIYVTNSNASNSKSVLDRCGFKTAGVPIISSARKPFTDVYFNSKYSKDIDLKKTIMVGDSSIDSLFAHELKIPSIIFDNGLSNTRDQIKKSLPSAIADEYTDFHNLYKDFLKGNLDYIPYSRPNFKRYNDLKNNNPLPDVLFTGKGFTKEYFPYGSPYFKQSGSDDILNLKKLRDVFVQDYKKAKDEFFWNNQIISKKYLKTSYKEFTVSVLKYLKGLSGSSFVIAAPNSLPEFAYRSDYLDFVASFANHLAHKEKPSSGANLKKLGDGLERVIARYSPKKSSAVTAQRSSRQQLKTMGINDNSEILNNYDNVILIDDVYTKGVQSNAAALALYKGGFRNNLYLYTYGKTSRN